jgi:hypothetical protein
VAALDRGQRSEAAAASGRRQRRTRRRASSPGRSVES